MVQSLIYSAQLGYDILSSVGMWHTYVTWDYSCSTHWESGILSSAGMLDAQLNRNSAVIKVAQLARCIFSEAQRFIHKTETENTANNPGSNPHPPTSLNKKESVEIVL